MTVDTKKEHDKYEASCVEHRCAVDAAFTATIKTLKTNGILDCSMDDCAEELIAAISYYVRRSAAR